MEDFDDDLLFDKSIQSPNLNHKVNLIGTFTFVIPPVGFSAFLYHHRGSEYKRSDPNGS